MTSDPHIHNYVLKNTKTKYGNVYKFYECIAEGPCKKRHKMTIERRKDLPPEK